MMHEFLKHTMSDDLGAPTSFLLDCQFYKQTTGKQQPLGVNESKLYLFLLSDWQKYIFFVVPQNFSN